MLRSTRTCVTFDALYTLTMVTNLVEFLHVVSVDMAFPSALLHESCECQMQWSGHLEDTNEGLAD